MSTRKKSVSESLPASITAGSSPEPILNLEQVSERLQLKPSTVRELLRKRIQRPLPSLKVGKFVRFKWSLIEKYLDESRGAA